MLVRVTFQSSDLKFCQNLLNLKQKSGFQIKRIDRGGWGFSSVVERLPRKCKALGSVPSSEKKNQKKKKKKKKRIDRAKCLAQWFSTSLMLPATLNMVARVVLTPNHKYFSLPYN